MLFNSTSLSTVVLYSIASSDKVSPYRIVMVVYLSFSSGLSVGTSGTSEVSSKNTSFVNLSRSTYDDMPGTSPLSVYCQPAQWPQCSRTVGSDTSYCATHNGYIARFDSNVLFALYSSLYIITSLPLLLQQFA